MACLVQSEPGGLGICVTQQAVKALVLGIVDVGFCTGGAFLPVAVAEFCGINQIHGCSPFNSVENLRTRAGTFYRTYTQAVSYDSTGRVSLYTDGNVPDLRPRKGMIRGTTVGPDN